MGVCERSRLVIMLCDEYKIRSGCCRKDRRCAGAAETGRAAGAATAVFCPDGAVAAGGQVRVGAGRRAAAGQRVEHRPACRGPGPGQDPAAAEPRSLGHVRRDERGAPVRRDRAGAARGGAGAAG